MELIDKQESAVAAYAPFYAELAKLESDNAALVFNYETPKGNKEARSHIFSLRKTKGALERVRKEAKAEALRVGRAVDSEANAIEARIEAMITVHQVKVDEIEQREKDRVAAHQDKLNGLVPSPGANTAEYRVEIARIEAIEIGPDWEEFMAQATKAKADALQALQSGLADAIRRDQEAAELARLRAETAAREQADRDAAIAKAAAEKAQREAEAKAAAEAEKVRQAAVAAEAEAKRKEAAAELALKQERERALAEQEAAARREMQLRLEAEQAEQRRAEAVARAEQDRKDAIARAEQQAAAAVQAEKDRVEAAARAEAAETAKRERNRAHKASTNRAALDALVAAGVPEDYAKQVVTLIATGKVPNVSIAY